MTNQTETAELIQAAAKLDPSAWLSAEGTPVRLHPDAAAALGGLLVAIAHTDDETLNKASLVRSAAFAAARVVAASSLDAACAHCGSNDHTWDDCEAYTRLTADAYARTLNTPPSAETCAAIRDRLHSGSEPAAVSAAVAPPANRAALRETVAEALMQWAEGNNSTKYASMRRPATVVQNAYSRADAVLAVLPSAGCLTPEYTDGPCHCPSCDPAAHRTDRAAVLADVERAIRTATRSCGYKAEDGCDFCNGVAAALDQVRRMADETATQTPAPDDRRLHACTQFGTWFDRSVCAEPCGAMHTRCTECGVALDACTQQPAAGARQDGDQS